MRGVANLFQVTLLHADGRRVHLELTLSPLQDEEYETVEIQGVAKKIGELARAKEVPSYEEARVTP
jgi:hypothetical protein